MLGTKQRFFANKENFCKEKDAKKAKKNIPFCLKNHNILDIFLMTSIFMTKNTPYQTFFQEFC